MIDVQNSRDERNIPIDRVGVKGLRYPVTVLSREQGRLATVAEVDMAVNLPHQFKGTHMSRFVEILDRHRGEVTIHTIPAILAEMKRRLEAESAWLRFHFPYFLEKAAPVSGTKAMLEYGCTFEATANHALDIVLGVAVPVTTVCPCSREISERGAHNQRGTVSVRVRFDGFVWIEELVEAVEASCSAPVYALLKREDEKFVTEHGYDHPMFVEDVVRAVAERLHADGRIVWFRVEVENIESIHNHNAFAALEVDRRGGGGDAG